MEDYYVKVISSAYKLLEFFPDQDPLKYKAKEKALTILENLTLIGDIAGWTSLKKERVSAELLDDIEIMKSYLGLGKNQGWIGGINYLILLKELNDIKSKIHPLKIDKYALEAAFEVQEQQPPESEKKEEVQTNLPMKVMLSKKEPEISGKALERQKKILEIITSMGKAQVADIIKEIPNITKRTIRRDLDELLKKAKIVRNGEWNRVFYQIS